MIFKISTNGLCALAGAVLALAAASSMPAGSRPGPLAALGSLDASFTAMVDAQPERNPVLDQPVGVSLEAVALLGLCAAAGLYRRPELRPALARCQRRAK
jgi:hypothetical protein